MIAILFAFEVLCRSMGFSKSVGLTNDLGPETRSGVVFGSLPRSSQVHGAPCDAGGAGWGAPPPLRRPIPNDAGRQSASQLWTCSRVQTSSSPIRTPQRTRTMPLNIPAITKLLSQVTSPRTTLACLTTRDGHLITYYSPTQPEEQAKTIAAIASGLIVNTSSTSTPLSALCEVSCYFLISSCFYLVKGT